MGGSLGGAADSPLLWRVYGPHTRRGVPVGPQDNSTIKKLFLYIDNWIVFQDQYRTGAEEILTGEVSEQAGERRSGTRLMVQSSDGGCLEDAVEEAVGALLPSH